MSPALLRSGLACAALGVAFLGALLVIGGTPGGWGLILVGLPLAGLLALGGDALRGDFAGTVRGRAAALARQTRPWMLWLALYAALKVPVPLWPEGFSLLALLGTGALFASALTYAWERAGARRALGMAALAFGVGLGVELLGSRTGFPFGVYTYAGAPAPTLLSVPLIVPLGWFALTLAATLLAGGRAWLAGILMVAWDVGLEPLMTAQGYWTWSDPAALWAGAPLQNFLGWWAVGTGLAWAFTWLSPGMFGGGGFRNPLESGREEARRPSGAEPVSSLPPGRLTFGVAYPVETFFLPGGLVLVGRHAEAGVTLAAMLAGLALARAGRGGRA